MMPVRLSEAEMKTAVRAGYQLQTLRPPGQKASIFGSMFSWFPSQWFGRPTFWPWGSGDAKPPVNAASSTSGQIVSPSSAMTLSAVWACVWLNARTIGTLPIDLKEYGAGNKATLRADLELYEVLRYAPNDLMSAADFWQMQLASLMLWGGGFSRKLVRKSGTVIGLDPLLPQYMTPFKDGAKIGYRYNEPRNPKTYTQAEIFHIRDRTLDGLTGLSVIEFARNSIGLAQAGENAASKTFKKGLHASGFLKVDKFLTSSQRDEFRSQINEFTGEGQNAGGTMVLEGPVTDYKQITLKPLDAELLASRQFSVEDVCRWFNTPPIMIGHASSGQTMWGSGVEQIFSGWTRLAIRPYLVVITQAIRQQLLGESERRANVVAEYDLDELMAADSAARASLYSQLTQNGIMTRNEARDKEGLPSMEGGDTLTVQSNLVPLDQLAQIMGGDGQNSASPAANQLRNALLNFLQISEQQQQKQTEAKS